MTEHFLKLVAKAFDLKIKKKKEEVLSPWKERKGRCEDGSGASKQLYLSVSQREGEKTVQLG